MLCGCFAEAHRKTMGEHLDSSANGKLHHRHCGTAWHPRAVVVPSSDTQAASVTPLRKLP